MLALTLRAKKHAGHVPRQLAAAFVLGLALGGSHVMSTLAAREPFDAASNGTLALLDSAGSAALLLLLLLLLSVIEARMTRALHRAIGRIDEVARTDTLTSLPRRMSFDQLPETAAVQADRKGQALALLFVALDGFKPINGSFGRRVGELAVFIPIVDCYGLIAALGNWVIDEACRQARVWRDEGLRMRVAIKLSVHQLRHPDLPERAGIPRFAVRADGAGRHGVRCGAAA
jgi:predicted signal transduction protein with EAL and GGDEF domain